MAQTLDKVAKNTELFTKKILVELNNRVIQKSPVDTGRFRANWAVGNGFVNNATSQAVDATGGGTIVKNALEINSIKINGQIIYITNSLPYAQRLEYEGWSKQAPAGMVRVSIAELPSIANKTAFEVKK